MRSLMTDRVFASATILCWVAVITVLVLNIDQPAQAQQAGQQRAQATVADAKALLDPADTVVLLLDHQSGLFQTVKDIGVSELRANTIALAKLAKLAKAPLITTASVPDGPNGPLMPEIQQSAPEAIYVPRKGEISAVG